MRRVWAMMIALALLIVPIGMIGGAAQAHQQPVHSTMSAGCHESEAAPKSKKAKGIGMSAECALACAALPANMARIADRLPVVRLPLHPPSAPSCAGATPESDDPPPRA
jgi:hypothetical protein